jgi:hypothetical protein
MCDKKHYLSLREIETPLERKENEHSMVISLHYLSGTHEKMSEICFILLSIRMLVGVLII